MKSFGTCIIKIVNLLENLQEISGTRLSITRSEFDSNPKKICSFSYAYKTFGYSWNNLLIKAKLKPKMIFKKGRKTGRKPENKKNYKEVSCLRCDSIFESPDPKLCRICKSCKNSIEYIEEFKIGEY